MLHTWYKHLIELTVQTMICVKILFFLLLIYLVIFVLKLFLTVLQDCNTLHKKCLYSELFWSTFSRISPYSVQMRENTDQNNSEYGHFSRSDTQTNNLCLGFLLFEKLVGKFNRILLNVSISSPLESSENQTFSGGFWEQNMGILAKNLKNFIKYFPVCFLRPGSCGTPSCFKKEVFLPNKSSIFIFPP